MNEYWLMLLLVSFGAAFAWAFFRQLARLAVWSSNPKLDAWRYGIITFCLTVVIGDTFEAWEAALMWTVSLVAYRAIRRERARFEKAMLDLETRAHRLSDGIKAGRHIGS